MEPYYFKIRRWDVVYPDEEEFIISTTPDPSEFVNGTTAPPNEGEMVEEIVAHSFKE